MKKELGEKKGSSWALSKKTKTGLLVGTVLLIFVVVLLVCLQQNREMNRLETENVALYTWFNTEKIEYDNSQLVFNRTDGAATELKVNGGAAEVVGAMPFFYQNERKVLFPQEMDIVEPRANNGQQSRLPALSILDGTSLEPKITFADYARALGSTFMFDGSDLYFFVNAMTLYINNEAMALPEFSFVTYNFNRELYVYNYDAQTAQYFENVDAVRAENANYNVNIATDTFESNGKSRLLVKNVGVLDVLR